MSDRKSLAWWTEPENDKHDCLWDVAGRIRRSQENRRLNNLLHASLYSNVSIQAFGPSSAARVDYGAHVRLGLNVVKNMTNAVVSKIAAKNKVKPTFLTIGGDYGLARRARQLEKLVQGVFYDVKLYRRQRPVFRDSCVFGTGIFQIDTTSDKKRIFGERVPTFELFADEGEAFYGDPPSIYRERWIDRSVLKALYPGNDEAIDKIDSNEEEMYGVVDRTSDVVPVLIAHRRPSEEGADDGRKVVCVRNATLEDEISHRFPYASLRWSEDITGFFGIGLAYELAGIQAEINDLLEEIQRAHRLIKGHWAVDDASKVLLQHINDDLASIVRFRGVQPTYYAPTAIAPDVYQHLWNLYGKAYEISGISQLSAQAQKPSGLNSGVALRAYEDIQTERFLEVGMALEEFTTDAAELVVECAREISEASGFVVKARSRNMIEQIDFRDVDLKRDEYVLQCFPTSMLPATPAGRLAFAQDMINTKMIDPEDGFELIDFPDTEQYAARRNAVRQVIERNIETILDTGKLPTPEPLDDHDQAIRITRLAYHKARLDGVDAERLELLRRYVALSTRMKAIDAAAMAPPAAPMGADAAAPPPAPVAQEAA